jgi:ArsR family transcriptional regulator
MTAAVIPATSANCQDSQLTVLVGSFDVEGIVADSRQPLYRMKAEFFKTLGHPARIRVLELLSTRDHTVSEMVREVGIEPANLSQQLSILRRAGLVTAHREGLTVSYALTTPQVAELLTVARAILTGVVAGQAELLHGEHGPPSLTGRSAR